MKEKTSKTAVIYTRVSSEAQVDGTSLDTQAEACRACAARLGLVVVSEHEDAGKSAKSTVGRDALAAAVDAAITARAALIVYKFDRLSRNLGDGYDLRDMLLAKGCRIISATEGEASASPVSKALYAMMMAFSELDNDMRAERCRTGMCARAKAGFWLSNPPVGFKLGKHPSGGTILVPDGDQSVILRTAFLDFISGRIDKSGLIKRLKDAGHPGSTIDRIIRSPVYGGIIRKPADRRRGRNRRVPRPDHRRSILRHGGQIETEEARPAQRQPGVPLHGNHSLLGLRAAGAVGVLKIQG